MCTHLQSLDSKQAPRRSSVYPQKAREEQAILSIQLSSAPKRCRLRSSSYKRRERFRKGASEVSGGGGRAEAGNSFPEAPRPSSAVTMSAGPAAGPGAPTAETVSALRPAPALPCPVGPSSWRHLHETSRTQRGGCGETYIRLVKAPGTPPTHPGPSPRPQQRLGHG